MPDDIPQITPEEATQRIESGALALDVREPDEWTAGHAPGAKHVPLGELTARLEELPKDRPIVAICRVGGRSGKAAEALASSGYDVANMAGGMQAWHSAGLPVVTDDGSTGSVI